MNPKQVSENVKIGTKVNISDCNFYDAEGVVISDTKIYWKVRVFNHKTMGKLWEGAGQKDRFMLFHKFKQDDRGNYEQKGFVKASRLGIICYMRPIEVSK